MYVHEQDIKWMEKEKEKKMSRATKEKGGKIGMARYKYQDEWRHIEGERWIEAS